MPVPASRPSAAMTAAGVARIRAHGTGDDQHGQGRIEAEAGGVGQAQARRCRPAEPAGAVEDQAAQERDAGQAQHGRQEIAGQPIGGAFQRRLVLAAPGRSARSPGRQRFARPRAAASMVSAPNWLSEPASTSSPGPLSTGRLSPVRATDIHGRPAVADHAIGGDPAARLDHDDVAHLQLRGQDALFLPVAQQPAAARTDLDDAADGPLGAVEGEPFQTFAEHADEHDLGGDERFGSRMAATQAMARARSAPMRPAKSESSEPYRMRAPPMTAAISASR